MSRQIEEAFNDCFERLMAGESLDSCIRRYPEHAAELDSMLRVAFDIKRKAYPVQPRPEFKYWSRVRMQGVQAYLDRQPAPARPAFSGLRGNLAVALAALLVIIIISSGTAAASSSAVPDQPLYGMKLAVEQAQLALTPADSDKAELFAKLAEKRAEEIAVMADQGKTDKVSATTTVMNYQLDQAAVFLQRYEASVAEATASTLPSAPAGTVVVPPPLPTGTVVVPPPATTGTVIVPPPTPTTTVVVPPPLPSSATGATGSAENVTAMPLLPPPPMPPIPPVLPATTPSTSAASGTAVTDNQQTTVKSAATQRKLENLNKIKSAINASASKSLTILQGALDKTPASTKPSLNNAIDRAKDADQRFRVQTPPNTGQKNDNQNQNQNNLNKPRNWPPDNDTKHGSDNVSLLPLPQALDNSTTLLK